MNHLASRSSFRVRKRFRRILVDWSEKNRRPYPWRGRNDSYEILISEILLRKTTRLQVSNVYERFIHEFPSPMALASATTKAIVDVIRPLGLENVRALSLSNLGEILVREFSSNIPSRKKDLLSLPGVGEYTANAVLCLAFNQKTALLDTNSIRVLCRVFSYEPEKKRARNDSKMWKFLEGIVPSESAREFNIGLLEFASEMCTSIDPKCERCPMILICDYGQRKSDSSPAG